MSAYPGVYWNIVAQDGFGNKIALGTGPIDFGSVPNTNEEVIQNVRMILTTAVGTEVLFRDFGTNYNFLDQPINVAENMIVAEVLQKVPRFEPRCKIVKVDFGGDITGTTGELDVTVVIQINLNALVTPSAVLSATPGSLKTVIDVSSGVAVVEEELVSS